MMHRTQSISNLQIIVLLFISSAILVSASSWPQKWHDSQKSNWQNCTAKDDACSISSGIRCHPSLLWSKENVYDSSYAPNGDVQAVVDDNKVVYYIRDAKYIDAIDLLTSNLIWETSLPTAFQHQILRSISTEMFSTSFSLILTTLPQPFLVLFSTSDGEYLWNQTIPEALPTLASAPIIDQNSGIVLVSTSWANSASLWVIQGQNETLPAPSPNLILWNQTVNDEDVYLAIPTIAPDGTIYALFYNERDYVSNLYAFFENGTTKWSTQFDYDLTLISGIRRDGAILLSSYDGIDLTIVVNPKTGEQEKQMNGMKVIAILPDDSMIAFHEVDTQIQKLDTNWETEWVIRMQQHVIAVAVYGKDTIYVTAWSYVSSALYALNYEDGTQLWEYRFAQGDELVYSPIIADEGHVIVRAGTTLHKLGTCSGHGSCNKDRVCQCLPNWFSNKCAVFCNQTRCASQHSGHASCNHEGVCKCHTDYYPVGKCDTYCNNDKCADSKSHHAQCTDSGSCECIEQYFGDKCELKCVNGTFVTPNDTHDSGYCKCNDKFYGKSCSVYCDPVDSCSNRGRCGHDGECICNGNKSLWQLSSYTGDRCQKKAVPWLLIGVCAAGLFLLIISLIVGTRLYHRWRLYKLKRAYVPID